ncbi:hypothetical protein [Actinoplanes sp. ATCC 53533]|uniref:hypothetical protein n=1 Tax=Actinoplanes sp. ATCC 53533 TaxID=1288362 RepID=UPI0011D0E42A|nr:hypothetical protein [Actinoplanes sp. ATCC 53533]
MRPVPYWLYRDSRRLAIRAVIQFCLTGVAGAAMAYILPRVGSADGDTSTAVTLLAGLASFLIWCAVVLSFLSIVAFSLVEIWALIAGVQRPGPSSESNEPR